MSPIDPAGNARMKNARDEAVCVSATYIGPAPKDNMSHAAPTLCMKAPTSEMKLAASKLRKVDTCKGRHKLLDVVLGIDSRLFFL